MPGTRLAYQGSGRAFCLLSLLVSLAGCPSGPGGGGQPDLGATPPDLTQPPPMMPALRLTAPTVWDTYTCAKITLTAIDGSGQPAAVSAATQVMLTGLGSAQSFATLTDCQGGTPASSLTLPQGQSSIDFYLRTAVSEALTLKAAATGYLSATLPITVILFQVLGQPDTSQVPNVILGQGGPYGVAVAGGKLLVADASGNRVLIWKSIPASSSVPPDVVLGQPDKSSVSANFGGGATNSATATNLNQPVAVASDGTRVFVADNKNNRVLVWNTFPTLDDQPADLALGQPKGTGNLTSNTANNGGVSGSSLSSPHGIVIDGTRLFISDFDNNRVLVWKTIPAAPTAADFALGQPAGVTNLTAHGGGTSATTMKGPYGLWEQGTQLFVADNSNSRVLVWKAIPAAPTAADFALGQPMGTGNLTSGTANNGGVSGGSLNHPAGVTSDGTRLFVSDTQNARVLVWNSLPASVVAADFVLGQNSLTTTATGTSATAVNQPNGVLSDGTHLLLADTSNNRTLVWNKIPTANATAASLALGQPPGNANLTSNVQYGGVVSGASMNFPNALDSDGTRLFVADFGNNRVLVWNRFPTQPDQPADFALGQPAGSDNLTSNAAPGPPTASSMSQPNAVSLIGGHLFVADSNNHRVLVWNKVPDAPTPADFALGQPAGAMNLISNKPNNGGVSGASMKFPYTMTSDGTRLFVCDANNNRLLAWKQVPTTPAPADFALGQPAGATNLTSNTVNNGGVSATSLSIPSLIFTDGKMLTVADTGNNRVLIWRSLPTGPSGADGVLGQPDFSHSASGATAQAMNAPEHAITDGTRFFVSDTNNNRVLVWNHVPTSNGEAATSVIGQPDLTSKAPNLDAGVSNKGLSFPIGLWADATRLFIIDTNNHRTVIVPTH